LFGLAGPGALADVAADPDPQVSPQHRPAATHLHVPAQPFPNTLVPVNAAHRRT